MARAGLRGARRVAHPRRRVSRVRPPPEGPAIPGAPGADGSWSSKHMRMTVGIGTAACLGVFVAVAASPSAPPSPRRRRKRRPRRRRPGSSPPRRRSSPRWTRRAGPGSSFLSTVPRRHDGPTSPREYSSARACASATSRPRSGPPPWPSSRPRSARKATGRSSRSCAATRSCFVERRARHRGAEAVAMSSARTSTTSPFSACRPSAPRGCCSSAAITSRST